MTTGFRFHPAEALHLTLAGLVTILLRGGPVAAVLVSEVRATVVSMFTHANVHLADRLDAWLRRVLVTPDLHRVHHSIRRDEASSNFGNSLVLWDQLRSVLIDPLRH